MVNLNNEPEEILDGNDSIVVPIVTYTVRGGRSLDVDGYTPPTIKAGHVIIKESSSDIHKPMPVTGEGGITSLGAITPGSGYADGSYSNVPLTGGDGSGATANVEISGGEVTSVTLVNGGTGYSEGDSLSASVEDLGNAGGSGFAVAVSSVGSVPTSYASLPGGHEYVGILRASILTSRPFAAIVTGGQVNHEAAPYDMTSILSAVKTAVPLIDFRAD